MWYSFWRNLSCESPSIWTWPSPHSSLPLLWHLRSYQPTQHFLRWSSSILLVLAHLHRPTPLCTTWFKHLNQEFESQTGWSRSLNQSRSPLFSKLDCIKYHTIREEWVHIIVNIELGWHHLGLHWFLIRMLGKLQVESTLQIGRKLQTLKLF